MHLRSYLMLSKAFTIVIPRAGRKIASHPCHRGGFIMPVYHGKNVSQPLSYCDIHADCVIHHGHRHHRHSACPSTIRQEELFSKLCGAAHHCEVLAALKGVEKLKVVATGLLVTVAGVLAIFLRIVCNTKECLNLLKRMTSVPKCLEQWIGLNLKKEMGGKMNKAVVLITQGAIICFPFVKVKYIYMLHTLDNHDQGSSDTIGG